MSVDLVFGVTAFCENENFRCCFALSIKFLLNWTNNTKKKYMKRWLLKHYNVNNMQHTPKVVHEVFFFYSFYEI